MKHYNIIVNGNPVYLYVVAIECIPTAMWFLVRNSGLLFSNKTMKTSLVDRNFRGKRIKHIHKAWELYTLFFVSKYIIQINLS